jgi:hypothetical protein
MHGPGRVLQASLPLESAIQPKNTMAGAAPSDRESSAFEEVLATTIASHPAPRLVSVRPFPLEGIDMAAYYVNRTAQPNGDHEVHKSGCQWLPADSNRIYLGEFNSCRPAVQAAKKHYSQVNGCATCASDCYTS